MPDLLVPRLPTRRRLLNQGVSVDAGRWRRLTSDLGLPQPEGVLGGADRKSISREDVLRVGDLPITTQAAEQLFYASMAWGLGAKARNLPRRLESLTHRGSSQLLEEAWLAVRAGRPPRECYEVLITQRGAGRIRYFGPAFASKYLYFANGTKASPRCLILDAVVAQQLRRFAWPSSPTSGWWPSTYERYCDLLGRWADNITEAQGRVEPDQIEMALFELR